MKEMDVDVIVLAGFLGFWAVTCFKEYANKIVNIHPSLIPSFAVTALRIESTSGGT